MIWAGSRRLLDLRGRGNPWRAWPNHRTRRASLDGRPRGSVASINSVAALHRIAASVLSIRFPHGGIQSIRHFKIHLCQRREADFGALVPRGSQLRGPDLVIDRFVHDFLSNAAQTGIMKMCCNQVRLADTHRT